MEPANFILLDLAEGLAFSIFIILPLGMVFLVGILLFLLRGFRPFVSGLVASDLIFDFFAGVSFRVSIKV